MPPVASPAVTECLLYFYQLVPTHSNGCVMCLITCIMAGLLAKLLINASPHVGVWILMVKQPCCSFASNLAGALQLLLEEFGKTVNVSMGLTLAARDQLYSTIYSMVEQVGHCRDAQTALAAPGGMVATRSVTASCMLSTGVTRVLSVQAMLNSG